MNNKFNKLFPSFNLLNSELFLDNRIIDSFSSCFYFNSFSNQNKDSLLFHLCQLNNLAITSSESPSHALVVTDASIKNNIATSITHIHIHNKSVIKMLHHAINITSAEVELFAIRCSLNQAVNSQGISKIIVVTNSIHAAKRIFDLQSHPF